MMEDNIKKLYKLLDLEPGASIENVKKAFRELSHIWHPDNHVKKPEGIQARAEEKFKEISQAYQELKKHLDRSVQEEREAEETRKRKEEEARQEREKESRRAEEQKKQEQEERARKEREQREREERDRKTRKERMEDTNDTVSSEEKNVSSSPSGLGWVSLGAALAWMSVLLGSFGAHSLRLAKKKLATFHTATDYLGYHALGLIAIGVLIYLLDEETARKLKRPAIWMSAGIVFFCGSLYGLVFDGPRFLGPITPLGGLCFMIGWFSLSFTLLKLRKSRP
jgi:uncharacterized membrane protein YgdD (TMEM256/DUF423 family)